MNGETHNWVPGEDYAIAFASGLGMTNAQIARALGPNFTRNMIIGRRHRLGLKSSSVEAHPEKVPQKQKYLPPNIWRDPEIDIVRSNPDMTTKQLASLLPGRSPLAIGMRRRMLGIAKRPRFSPDEDRIIADRFNAFVPVEEIAKEIDRSEGVTRQRILLLGLRRDGRKTRLARRFGFAALNLSDDPAEARRIILASKKEEADRIAAESRKKIATALELMMLGIKAGNDRRTEMQAALLAGATLQDVGDRLCLTRERVRQIVHHIRQPYSRREPKQYACSDCGTLFQHSNKGKPKRCLPCRSLATEAYKIKQRERLRAYMDAYRKTEKFRAYKRDWTRRDRLKKKMLAMDPDSLADVLKEVAATVTAFK